MEKIEGDVIKEESQSLKEDLKDFMKKNEKNIQLSMINAKTGFLLNYWISNLEITSDVLEETLKIFKRKYRFLSRKTFRDKNLLNKRLERIYKALFLVLFRIVEQIYMITQNIKFIPGKEIDFLIEDVVYLKNIARSTYGNI